MTRLNAQSVRDILGHAEEEFVLQLIDTGASEADLLAAIAWLDEDDAMGRAHAEPPTGHVAELCRILAEARERPEEEGRGE